MEYAESAFSDMYSIMDDVTGANTTVSNFMKLETSTENLNGLLNSATGAWATYGDSIPLDGLAESVNETTKVGQITVILADALNWAGVSEDSFNESLAACSSEQERQQFIVETLNDLYSESADKYRENDASIISARKANTSGTVSATWSAGCGIKSVDFATISGAILRDFSVSYLRQNCSRRSLVSTSFTVLPRCG